ncbi:hypothetical protein FA95DRAFT_1604113 [Auriscalpium vulgare]|uniref:Uncharacterized protein n=1 Tax=Auriscalpium vulgare TaxID=40419 RepID=A0ACB8S1R3_9AGAM|nr:hypothetical protein FA95DRAFT_1604113 [Auriscalpium vulgare]
MALSSPSTVPPPLDTVPSPLLVARSDSRASNVSAASAASLTRRSRIRGRTRALTLTNPRRGKSLGPSSAAEDERMPTAGDILATPPLPSASSGASPFPPDTQSPLPERPPRSPLRSSNVPLHPAPDLEEYTIAGPSSRAVDDADGARQARRMRVDTDAAKRRTRKRGSSVPRDYRLSILSQSSSPTSPLFSNHGPMQTMPHFKSLRDARQRLRESYLTQKSGTTTSAYPLSSSTLSGTDGPPSPRSLADSFQDKFVSSVDPDHPGDDDEPFDVDDVSYRLRLLVNNNYFLPPAHSKPSPSELAPVVKKSAKAPAPTFLDLFRVGKSKSKPGTPDASPLAPQPPILRTTSDSTTASGWVQRPHANSLPHSPISSRPRAQTTRVAVVRETLDDLVTAAKQAEQDIKVREEAAARKLGQDGQKEKPEPLLDVIDPTDTVDLPLPSEESPFAIQTSTLHGLGIEESVGAAVLAERLPPGSPGVWSLDPEEEAWRKALLQEAVGHSLNNSLVSSPSPQPRRTVSASPLSPMDSSSRGHSTDHSSGPRPGRSPTPSIKRNLGQRIVLHEDQEAVASAVFSLPVSPAEQRFPPVANVPLRPRLQERRKTTQLHPSLPPERAETPATPHRPLAPPPRKQIPELPQHSPSHSATLTADGAESLGRSHTSLSSRSLRKATSSPLLRELHESAMLSGRSAVSMTPPLLPAAASSTPRYSESISHLSHRHMDSLTSGSRYSGDSEFDLHVEPDLAEQTRPSFASTVPTRPSVSEYSQPSPTVSAFKDALYYQETFGHSMEASTSFESTGTEHGNRMSSASTMSQGYPPFRLPRHNAMSPPPRTSSSLAAPVLSPPPRSSSFSARTPLPPLAQFLASSPRPSLSSSDPGHSQFVSALELDTAQASALPLPQYPLGNRPQLSGMLMIPALSNAPAPASPIEFFDRIQMDHSLDDLESSSDESDSEADRDSVYTDARARETDASGPRTPFMPGTASTPYVSPSASTSSHESERRSPIVNVPARAMYFKDTVGEQTLSNYDLLQYTRPADGASTSSTVPRLVDRQLAAARAAEAALKRDGRTASLQRLDGLLIQHMEAERDTLSRIAQSAKETTQP